MITLLSSYTDALQGFLHTRISAAIEEPNAGHEPLPEAAARHERRL